MRQLTLYSRQYCHLCHDMLAALEALRGEFEFEVMVVDLDLIEDSALLARYDERVPVLVAAETELCHYFLDLDAVRSCLAEVK